MRQLTLRVTLCAGIAVGSIHRAAAQTLPTPTVVQPGGPLVDGRRIPLANSKFESSSGGRSWDVLVEHTVNGRPRGCRRPLPRMRTSTSESCIVGEHVLSSHRLNPGSVRISELDVQRDRPSHAIDPPNEPFDRAAVDESATQLRHAGLRNPIVWSDDELGARSAEGACDFRSQLLAQNVDRIGVVDRHAVTILEQWRGTRTFWTHLMANLE